MTVPCSVVTCRAPRTRVLVSWGGVSFSRMPRFWVAVSLVFGNTPNCVLRDCVAFRAAHGPTTASRASGSQSARAIVGVRL